MRLQRATKNIATLLLVLSRNLPEEERGFGLYMNQYEDMKRFSRGRPEVLTVR